MSQGKIDNKNSSAVGANNSGTGKQDSILNTSQDNLNSSILSNDMDKGNITANDGPKNVLEASGILNAYQYFLKSLCQNGLPGGNVYEFAAQQILKYEKKQKQVHIKKEQIQADLEKAQLKRSFSPHQFKDTTNGSIQSLDMFRQMERSLSPKDKKRSISKDQNSPDKNNDKQVIEPQQVQGKGSPEQQDNVKVDTQKAPATVPDKKKK